MDFFPLVRHDAISACSPSSLLFSVRDCVGLQSIVPEVLRYLEVLQFKVEIFQHMKVTDQLENYRTSVVSGTSFKCFREQRNPTEVLWFVQTRDVSPANQPD